MAIPQTIEEAQQQGYEVRSLSREEADRIIRSDQPASRPPRPGPFDLPSDAPADVPFDAPFNPVRECTNHTVGRICWQGNCVGGWRDVLYCDGTMGCTRHARVRC